jgi:hypothetical protein
MEEVIRVFFSGHEFCRRRNSGHIGCRDLDPGEALAGTSFRVASAYTNLPRHTKPPRHRLRFLKVFSEPSCAMVSPNTSPGLQAIRTTICRIENGFLFRQKRQPRVTKTAVAVRVLSLHCERFYSWRPLSSEFLLRDPLTLHHHDRQRFGTFCCEPGPIHNGEIEDVAFNGALQFVASFCVHTGFGSEPLPNPGNSGLRCQTIL